MLGHIIYKIFYGSFHEYSNHIATLIYTNISNNVKSVEVLNEPVLDWELGKAGSITLLLSPNNTGYSVIECKKKLIFIEKNGVLIWHGRVISDSYDIDKNREIICEGALNFLLDSHVNPRNFHNEGTAKETFENLLDAHRRNSVVSTSLILGRGNWFFNETNGKIEYFGSDNILQPILNEYPSIHFKSTGATSWNLFAWSNPSIWQYSMHWNHYVRVSFDIEFTKSSANDKFVYGLHLRDTAVAAVGSGSRLATVDGPPVTTSGSSHVEHEFFLGPNGLDAPGHDDAYIGFNIYLYATSAGAEAIVSNIKVERCEFDGYDFETTFPPTEGERTAFGKQLWAPNEYWSVDDTDYPTILDAINKIFIDEYGGYIYAGCKVINQELTPVINYISGTPEYDVVGEDLPRVIFGKNLLSFKKTKNYEDLSTVIIPIGDQIEDLDKKSRITAIRYRTGVKIGSDGALVTDSDSRHTIAEITVNQNLYTTHDKVYFICGVGKKDSGLYTIVDNNYASITHQTFSTDTAQQYSRYEYYEINIPKDSSADTLIVYFFNENNEPNDDVFSIYMYNFGDREEYVTLENYIGDRDEYLGGTKYFVPDYDALQKYNWIEKVVKFEGVTTQEKLLSSVRKYCAALDMIKTSYEVEAVDLAPISDTSENYSLGTPGSYAQVVYPALNVDEILCITKCSINLRDFAKSRYSLANLPPPNLSDLIAKGTIHGRLNNFAG